MADRATGMAAPAGPMAVACLSPPRTPMLPAPAAVRGTVRILVERCKGCELCVEYCPTDVLALSGDFNAKGYHYPVVAGDDCIACQACSTICPEFAIYAVPAGESAESSVAA